MLPTKVPADKMALSRKAFADLAQDPQMLDEAEKAKIEMTYLLPARWRSWSQAFTVSRRI